MTKFLQNIFSIKNNFTSSDKVYKVITILGIKLKMRNYKKEVIRIEKLKEQKLFEEKLRKENIINLSANNTLKNKIIISQCPICGSKEFYILKTRKLSEIKKNWENEYKINPIPDIYLDDILETRECCECGVIYYNIDIPDSSELYENLEKFPWYYPIDKWDYDVALESLKKIKPTGLFEIGAGNGYFLDKIKNAIPKIKASEFNEKALKLLTQKGYSVTNDSLDNINESFDMVCAFQVLEHVKDIDGFMKDCLKLLNTNGYLILTNPNPYGIFKYIKGVMQIPPHHRVDISYQTYEYLAKHYNLEIVEYKTEPLSLIEYQIYVEKLLNLTEVTKENMLTAYELFKKDFNYGHSHFVCFKKTDKK